MALHRIRQAASKPEARTAVYNMLQLYNTLTRKKEPFTPLDAKNVRMYVCGPTVYDRPHLGNARSVVVYDVLYRLLMHVYGRPQVTYVRNITDVDDKINAAAIAGKESISALTKRVEDWFQQDIATLNCLNPTHEPHATQHIRQMIAMIEQLIAGGHAYAAQGHVLFAVDSYPDYGALSGRRLDELVAGARIEVESYKKHPGDFVLWKPSDEEDDPSSVFDSPWGKGRPGWHIECSAMSKEYLGADFDIHGGGADLMFPHHENEIAQSRCSAKNSSFAHTWVHNGFLTVNGEKMSKSLGNFTTVKELLDKGVKGETIRLAYLMTKYNEPLDWSDKLLSDAKKILDGWYRMIGKPDTAGAIYGDFIEALSDDLNTPKAISLMHTAQPEALLTMGRFLGLLHQDPAIWFKGNGADDDGIQFLIDARAAAKKAKNWAEADKIREQLANQGILLEDRPNGTTDWRRA
jgi:cysteinyl-tRNA synthetase